MGKNMKYGMYIVWNILLLFSSKRHLCYSERVNVDQLGITNELIGGVCSASKRSLLCPCPTHVWPLKKGACLWSL